MNMLFLFIPLSLIPLFFIIGLAFSKKSSPMVKKTALVALILLIIVTGICLFVILNISPAAGTGPAIPFNEEAPAGETSELRFLGFFAVFLLTLIVLLLILQRREKKSKKKQRPPAKSW